MLAFALAITSRSLELLAGSAPPSLTATVHLTVTVSLPTGTEVNNSYATYDINLHSGKGDINGSIRLLSDSYYNIHAHAHNGESNIKDSNNAIAILDIFPTLTVTTDNGNINLELKKVIG